MPPTATWLPPPPDGTAVAAGFDGSENSDFTGIRLETREGFMFTPRYGPDRRPTIWDPADWGGRIPREQIRVAWGEIVDRFKLKRAYCDPGFHDELSWETDIEAWASEWGEEIFLPWPTNQVGRMFPAIKRFEADLRSRAFTHDGCPVTTAHVGNCRRVAQSGDRYALGKPAPMSKIDLAVTSVIAHEAACDQRAAGWSDVDRRVVVFRR